MSHRWISSLNHPQHSNDSLMSIYFPFGSQRQKMKAYIFDQLHGKQTLQNQQILKRFRQETLLRRHNYLHRYSDKQRFKTIDQLDRDQTLPTLDHKKNLQSSFISYKHKYNSLVPRQKSPPPIFKYSSLQSTMDKQKNIKSNQTVKRRKANQPILMIKLSNSKSRSQSVQIGIPFKEKALAKIKQIAKKRRQHKEGQESSTDSSQIVQELQHKVQESKVAYEYNSKQLKRFKEYRRYIKSRNV